MKKAKAQHVAKPAKPAKPPAVHHQKLTAAQHHKAAVAAHKAALTRKHNAAVAKKHAGTRKHAARGWSPDSDVALCTARAFAESLRLATGRAVGDSAVLDVYWATAGDADAGASIWATAEAILAGGLGGHAVLMQQPFSQPATDVIEESVGFFSAVGRSHGLILGLALPEPHAVAVAPDGGWWSWGEPFSPLEWPGLVIEEAWQVMWS